MSTSPTEPAARAETRRYVAYLAALSGISAFGIDVMLPALGEIRTALGLPADSTRLSLLVTVYLFGLGIGQVLYGPLADRYGRRPIVLAGLGAYVTGALGAAAAGRLEVMIAFRFVMGLGAASPRAMSLTIARDRFEGDAMTRIVSLVMLFFQLSPAIAPLLGEGLLVVGPWPGPFVFCAVAAAGVALWSRRMPETLDPAHRRPLTFARTTGAARAIAGSRWALGHGLVLMFEFTAFYVYLSSSELIFEDVFDRRALFAWCFAASALLQAGGNLAASRLVPRLGTARLMTWVVAGYLVAGAVFLAVTAGARGRPSFLPWLGLLFVLNVLHALVLTTANSQAMQPLAALAGIGSGLIGTMSMMGAAIMSSVVASTIDGSATPMAAAYAGFGLLAALSLWWARGGRSDPIGVPHCGQDC